MTTVSRNVLLVAFAVVSFVIAFLIAVNAFSDGNFGAFIAAGLALFAAAHLP